MQILEELAKEPETIQQIHGAYQVTSVSKSTIQSLGKRLEKKDRIQCHRICTNATVFGFHL